MFVYYDHQQHRKSTFVYRLYMPIANRRKKRTYSGETKTARKRPRTHKIVRRTKTHLSENEKKRAAVHTAYIDLLLLMSCYWILFNINCSETVMFRSVVFTAGIIKQRQKCAFLYLSKPKNSYFYSYAIFFYSLSLFFFSPCSIGF